MMKKKPRPTRGEKPRGGKPRKRRVEPGRCTAEEAARVLRAAGSVHATAERVEADVAAGAPVNRDGTLNLVRYCAWLAGKETGGDHHGGHGGHGERIEKGGSGED